MAFELVAGLAAKDYLLDLKLCRVLCPRLLRK